MEVLGLHNDKKNVLKLMKQTNVGQRVENECQGRAKNDKRAQLIFETKSKEK